MRRIPLILLSIAFAAAAVAGPQLETINIDQTMTVDPVGDGVLTLKLTLDGEQFQMW